MKDKDTIREEILSKRSSLSAKEQNTANKKIFTNLVNANLLQNKKIAFYKSMDNEICPQLALLYAHEQNCQCYLPKIDFSDPTMDFHEYSPNDTLTINKLGIEEPQYGDIIDPKNLDIVFVPLVAFDIQGNRLGRGKGYYDIMFEFKNTSINSIPILIGLGYEFQKTNAIDPEPHDIKLDHVITESEQYIFIDKNIP